MNGAQTGRGFCRAQGESKEIIPVRVLVYLGLKGGHLTPAPLQPETLVTIHGYFIAGEGIEWRGASPLLYTPCKIQALSKSGSFNPGRPRGVTTPLKYFPPLKHDKNRISIISTV
jgi:hypothetical protein